MELMLGDWAIPQVQRMSAGLRSTGTSYVAKIYRCATCGTMEFVDEEASSGGA